MATKGNYRNVQCIKLWHQAVLCRLSNFNRTSEQLTLLHRVDHAKFSEALLHCILMSLMSPLLRGPR